MSYEMCPFSGQGVHEEHVTQNEVSILMNLPLIKSLILSPL